MKALLARQQAGVQRVGLALHLGHGGLPLRQHLRRQLRLGLHQLGLRLLEGLLLGLSLLALLALGLLLLQLLRLVLLLLLSLP